MKLFAARAEIDADDIILLYHQLGFTRWTKALTWLSKPIQDGRSGEAEISSSPKSWTRCSTKVHHEQGSADLMCV